MKKGDKKHYRYLDAISSSDYAYIGSLFYLIIIHTLSVCSFVVLTRLSQRTAQTSGGESDKPQLSDNTRARAGEL